MSEQSLYHLDQVGIRAVKERELYSDKPINKPEDAVQVVADTLLDYDRELFCVVNLQTDMRPINMNIVSVGVLNEAVVHPREVLKSAILSNAASVILFHNHPSQNVKPSEQDIAVTDQLIQACALVGIPVLDHIIVGSPKEYYSFKSHNKLPLPALQFTKNESELKFDPIEAVEPKARDCGCIEKKESVLKNLQRDENTEKKTELKKTAGKTSRRKCIKKEQTL